MTCLCSSRCRGRATWASGRMEWSRAVAPPSSLTPRHTRSSSSEPLPLAACSRRRCATMICGLRICLHVSAWMCADICMNCEHCLATLWCCWCTRFLSFHRSNSWHSVRHSANCCYSVAHTGILNCWSSALWRGSRRSLSSICRRLRCSPTCVWSWRTTACRHWCSAPPKSLRRSSSGSLAGSEWGQSKSRSQSCSQQPQSCGSQEQPQSCGSQEQPCHTPISSVSSSQLKNKLTNQSSNQSINQ